MPLKAWERLASHPFKGLSRAAQHTHEVPRCEAFSFDQLKSHKSFTGCSVEGAAPREGLLLLCPGGLGGRVQKATAPLGFGTRDSDWP